MVVTAGADAALALELGGALRVPQVLGLHDWLRVGCFGSSREEWVFSTCLEQRGALGARNGE